MSFKVIGINICETRDGIKLDDGGCALIEDGIPRIAIAEERLSRKKHDGGFIRSLDYCLKSTKNRLEDIDAFVFSNCCDEPLDKVFLKKLLKKYNIDIPDEKIIICPSHHLSHAYSAFLVSPFKKAIILVADNEGNILEKRYKDYWLNRLERTSFYLGENTKIKLLGRLHDGFKELGIGAAYNYFTQGIGFKSFHDAGKTMALAAYGKGKFKNIEVFDKNFKCLLKHEFKNRYEKIGKVARNFISKKAGINIDKTPRSIKYPSELQKEMTYLIQAELEKVMINLIKLLIKKTDIRKLCIAGGVGLNCVANYKILTETDIEDIFIQPAAGDTGQCLGNALYGYYHYNPKKKIKREYIMDNVFLGKEYTEKEIRESLKKYSAKLVIKRSKNYHKEVVKLISQGKIIGWFHGKSEFGPRALGNRSILANPQNPETKKILDKKIKFREPYRPYAPSVLEEEAKHYFKLDKPSPFMLLAVPVKQEKRELIPAVIHVDGTSRIQTVNAKQNANFYKLIKEFKKLTGIPVLLNTSFNKADEPIVESPEDAIKCFLDTNIDYLSMKDYIISKKLSCIASRGCFQD